MATYVLVHGGWHGGWCWKYVGRLLRAAGHEVFTPTLTGCGERVHLASGDTGLETHIQDVVNVLEYEDLSAVVLVGHSMGGTVITGVADRAAPRLAQLVYLDAEIPNDGQCDADCVGPEALAWAQTFRDVGYKAVSPPVWKQFLEANRAFGITVDADARWLHSKLTPHPLKAFLDPVQLTHAAPPDAMRTFVMCSQGNSPASSVERIHTEPGWQYRVLDTGHDAMVTMPRELTDILLDIVR